MFSGMVPKINALLCIIVTDKMDFDNAKGYSNWYNRLGSRIELEHII